MHILDPRCVYVKHYFRHYLQYLRSIKPLAHSICAVFVQYPAVFLGGISAVFHSIRIVFHSILQYLHSICSCLTVQYYSIAYPQVSFNHKLEMKLRVHLYNFNSRNGLAVILHS